MNVRTIKTILKPLGILSGCNLYPNEPSPLAHCVSVKMGAAKQAIDAIKVNGGDAWHSHSFGPYTESINVRRRDK